LELDGISTYFLGSADERNRLLEILVVVGG
jgi:hypothetical protein